MDTSLNKSDSLIEDSIINSPGTNYYTTSSMDSFNDSELNIEDINCITNEWKPNTEINITSVLYSGLADIFQNINN